MSIQPYDAYSNKDRISEWTGAVPDHWDSRKLKFVANCFASNIDKKSKPGEQPVLLCNYTDVYYNDEITNELEFMKATATPDQIEKFLLRERDTIITKDSEDPNDIAVPTFVPKTLPGVICAYHLSMIRPKATMNVRFLNWAFQASYARSFFATRANGLTRYGLGAQALGEWDVPIPTSDEQKQIAAFLDYETAKIDALIEKQQLIALLGEKRQAVISHAVTKGLNPDAPMRDSGVEWLGEVPKHWTVMQLRRWIADMEQGKSPECDNREASNGEWAVLKTGCVNGGTYHEDENKALPSAIRPNVEYEVQVGDVLMSRASGSTDLIGSVAYVEATRERNLLSDKIFRIRFWDGVDGKFFRYFMASTYMRQTIVRSISGAEGMANNITKTAILAFKATLPPIDEQSAIVEHIESTTSRMESLIERAEDALLLLHERRTALISAAVTGKIDVRGWKPPSSEAKRETETEVA